MIRFAFPFLALWLALPGTLPLQATPLNTFHFSGTFGSSYQGPLNNGAFYGWFSIAANLPITPVDTGTSYIYLSDFDAIMQKGTTTVEFKKGVFGVTGLLSASYETATGGDSLYFYDNTNDGLILYFAAGFKGMGAVIPVTSKNYLSDAYVGGSGSANYSNVTAGLSSAPEPATAWMLGAAALAVLWWRRRAAGSVRKNTL